MPKLRKGRKPSVKKIHVDQSKWLDGLEEAHRTALLENVTVEVHTGRGSRTLVVTPKIARKSCSRANLEWKIEGLKRYRAGITREIREIKAFVEKAWGKKRRKK